MRNMSFALTTHQAWAQVKTVTRRDPETWKDLKVGDELQQVEKGMGLKKGERAKQIHTIRITGVELEPLEAMTPDDVAREGFPHLAPSQFVAMYRAHHKDQVNARRIEFVYTSRFARYDSCVICAQALPWITNGHDAKGHRHPDTRGGMPFPSHLRTDPWPWDQHGHSGEGPRVCQQCFERLSGWPGVEPLIVMEDAAVSGQRILIPRGLETVPPTWRTLR